MSTPSALIPSPVASFEVRCSVGQYVMDSDDSGKAPDLIAVGGRVEITPSLTKPLRVLTVPPRVVSHDTLKFNIDPDSGELIHQDGTVGVFLIDSRDPNLDPQDWTYTANVIPNKGRSWSVTFRGPEEGSTVVDLGTIVSTQPSGGAPTPVPGLSAYQIALQNGFVGTEAEWLASLIGHSPAFTWSGTSLVIDGVEGPNLRADPEPTTGPRDITSLLARYIEGDFSIERIGNLVFYNLYALKLSPTLDSNGDPTNYWYSTPEFTVPVGWRPRATPPYVSWPLAPSSSGYSAGPLRISRYGQFTIYDVPDKIIQGSGFWVTDDDFPTEPLGEPYT